MFMPQAEVNMIKADYERNLRSPEASSVTLRWRTLLAPESSPVKDEVYGIDTRPQEADPKEKTGVAALHQIVSSKDYKMLATGMVQEGDSIFYFSTTLDLGSPNELEPVIPGSLIIETGDGEKWQPKLRESNFLQRHLGLRIGNLQIGQVMVCELLKTDN
jgi:hypothetical protein